MDTRLRDIYGLPCCVDYEELLETYTPIWLELDDCQTCHWQRFLHTAAQQLGVPLAPGSEQQGHLCFEEPASHAVVVSVVQQLLARGERHAPEVGQSASQQFPNLLVLCWCILGLIQVSVRSKVSDHNMHHSLVSSSCLQEASGMHQRGGQSASSQFPNLLVLCWCTLGLINNNMIMIISITSTVFDKHMHRSFFSSSCWQQPSCMRQRWDSQPVSSLQTRWS
jgi:hypothetical protein